MQPPSFEPARLKQLFGVSKLPRPLNLADLTESIRAHYPAGLQGSGISGSVLLSLSLDEQGAITSARAVEPPSGDDIRAVLRDAHSGTTRELEPARNPHPALARAAEEAVRSLRFAPAERDGQPVPFADYRMTIGFSPPARDAGTR